MWLLGALFWIAADAAPVRTMAITVDDLPVVGGVQRDHEERQAVTDGLLRTLTQHEVPAIGFVNENKLYDDDVVDSRRVSLLSAWLAAGMELGNHTFSHPSLHRTELDDYLRDLDRGEKITRRLVEKHGSTYRYFRHPFLHTGRDLDTRDAVIAHLSTKGMQVAPVTIDNSDWLFARAYDVAAGREDVDLANQIADDYVQYMVDCVVYYEGQSIALFDREIPQILLIHANRLNADHLGRLLSKIEERGYTFVSLTQALDDAAFTSEDQFTGPGGITWLHRWAITAKVDPTMFAGEPDTPDYIHEVSGIAR